MNVHLTFDVEVWCDGWDDLDAKFPAAFERYIYGRSARGDYALPKTLEILARHRLHGVFFVEPLFSARFGALHLERIVALIRDAGQEVQLHLHPEWTDEIDPSPLPRAPRVKRQHLTFYDVEEQAALVGFARRLLEAAGAGPVSAFRAGSFAANRDTFEALSRNGIAIDSSLNACYAVSGADLRAGLRADRGQWREGVATFPVAVFRDGFGRLRPAHVSACSVDEFRESLCAAQARGWQDYVIVSHNFELLHPGSCTPDRIVVERFERLCAFLAGERERFPVVGFERPSERFTSSAGEELPRVSRAATARRYVEQGLRRLTAARR